MPASVIELPHASGRNSPVIPICRRPVTRVRPFAPSQQPPSDLAHEPPPAERRSLCGETVGPSCHFVARQWLRHCGFARFSASRVGLDPPDESGGSCDKEEDALATSQSYDRPMTPTSIRPAVCSKMKRAKTGFSAVSRPEKTKTLKRAGHWYFRSAERALGPTGRFQNQRRAR